MYSAQLDPLVSSLLRLTRTQLSLTNRANNGVTLKSGLGVVQGHRKWYRRVARVWFPISRLL